MEAGRHGAYRGDEFRNRESDVEAARGRNYYNPKEEYDRLRDRRDHERDRDRGHNVDRGRERNFRDRVRVRQKDIKEREVANGGYRSSSGTSNSNSGSDSCKRDVFPVRTVDREPGELSSGSGSDDGEMSEPCIMDNRNEVRKSENGIQSSPSRKRKFSPIVWDREEKVVSNTSRHRTDPANVALPAPPPLPLSFSPSAYLSPRESVQPSKLGPNSSNSLMTSSTEPPMATGSASSESLAPQSPASPAGQGWNSDRKPGQLEEDDYVPMMNISASRWADEANSPEIEGEVSGKEGMPKGRKAMPVTKAAVSKASSPEIGEVTWEGSEGARAKSFCVDEDGRSIEPGREDECTETVLYKNGLMEVDKEDASDEVAGQQTETDTEGEEDSRMTSEPMEPPQRSINMLQGCRSVDDFERLNKIDEGTYGVVYRARDKKSGEIVALKKVKMEKEREGFPLTSLREINILLSFHHASIVDVKEVVVGSNLDSIFMVMEYMEHDLKGLMEAMKKPFHPSQVKCLMLQLLEGVKYLHDNWVLHRDLKTSNLLLNNRGELKICDFGLSRQYGSPLKPYTHLVVTLWYRAPELLLGAKQYSTAIDMWSLGCIMAELLTKEPLFSGKTEFDQLDKIFKTIGTPNEKIWPGFVKLPGVKVNFVKQPYNKLRDKLPREPSFHGRPTLSDLGFDLLNRLLTYDPEKRITAEQALNHGWFHEVPLPTSKDFFPTFPAQHAQDRRQRRIMKSPDPLEELRRKELQGELGSGTLFG